ncbi:MAG: hypothetical protein QHH07_01455 [Sedimentisphaerales bacterium]|nr:hypothetical protein [Sedimentisphaerales bacterium]
MKSHNTLGLYVSTNRTVGVCMASRGHDRRILDRFTVSIDGSSAEPFKELAAAIASSCTQKRLAFAEVMVALDCALYMQHAIHSNFTNLKQISATVRYDTEEVLATDISTMALSFQVSSTGQNGSELKVFTARSSILEQLILAFQAHDMDPVAIEPDAISLARYMHWAQTSGHMESAGTGLAVVVSDGNCYHLLCRADGSIMPIRAFPLGKDKTTGLAGQTFTTIAALEQPVDQVLVYDASAQVDGQMLAQRLGQPVADGRWFERLVDPADQGQQVAIAMALGAAMARDDRVHTANFRNDFMPYQGKRLRLEKAARWAAISLTVLVIAIGAHVQMRLVQAQQDIRRLKDRVAKDYAAVMGGRSLPSGRNPADELKREIRRIKAIRSGELSLQESVLARLTLLLKAFNSYGRSGLQIDSIEITTSTIRLDGSTPSRLDTQSFFKVLRQGGLNVARETVDDTTGRCTFSVILVPMEGAQKAAEQ